LTKVISGEKSPTGVLALSEQQKATSFYARIRLKVGISDAFPVNAQT
jgi:hypothetical protein